MSARSRSPRRMGRKKGKREREARRSARESGKEIKSGSQPNIQGREVKMRGGKVQRRHEDRRTWWRLEPGGGGGPKGIWRRLQRSQLAAATIWSEEDGQLLAVNDVSDETG
ncbi:hypothetical protein SLA2020_479030 [Shorea laevis]